MAQRILLVDDEPLIQRAYHRALQRTGFDVELVANAERAVERLAQESFDVVLTDHDMPGMKGIWLLEQVRARHPRVRRILMSGGSPPGLDNHVGSGLVQAFLAKPIETDVLLAALSGRALAAGE